MPPSARETLDLNLPSSMDYLSLVNGVAEEIATRLEVDEALKDTLTTAVIEACTNAIEHGNREDPSKTVKIRFEYDAEAFSVTVTDEGKGFDLKLVDDPVKPENLLRERGRGIFILRAFMDEVNYRFDPAGGTTVQLVKNLGAKAQTAS